MKIVITGALGHIDLPGLVPDLEIIAVDNMLTQRYAALFDLPPTAGRRFVEADAIDGNLAPLIEGADAVIHLAAITDATASFDKQDEVECVNYNATRSVALACAAARVPLISPSSTSVYGTQNEVVDEDCSEEELKPQSPYAETKLREEALLAELGESAGLRFFVGRLGTIFGPSPGMRFHTAVNKFCWQAVMGIPLTVWETAYDQKRPYLGLNDAVRAVAFVLQNGLFDNRVYNVVSANSTVRDIVETIRALIPETEISFVQSRIMNQLSFDVANTRFREAGFEFTDELRDGIAETVKLLAAANGRTVAGK
jgi:UDP-glucose 4-epimerase